MYCEKCGKQIDSNSMFCESCGTKLDFMTPPETAVPNFQTVSPEINNQLAAAANNSVTVSQNTDKKKKTLKTNLILGSVLFAGFIIAAASAISIFSDNNDYEPSYRSDEPDRSISYQVYEDTDYSNMNNMIYNQVLIDDENIKVTAEEIIHEKYGGDSLRLNVENKSDAELVYSGNNIIVNDLMTTESIYSKVLPGKSAICDVSLTRYTGVYNVNKIEIDSRIYDADSYNTITEYDLLTITTLNTEKDAPRDNSGMEIYNDNGLLIRALDFDTSDDYKDTLNIYIENNSDKEISISSDDFSVNDIMIDEYLYSTVYPEKKAYTQVSLFRDELEKKNIGSVDNIDFNYTLHDKNYDTISSDSVHIDIDDLKKTD